jgi:peptide/nickel transport system substrate-binding protein
LTASSRLAIAMLAALAAAGCAHAGGPGAGPLRSSVPGTLRYADLQDIQNLNPLLRAQAAGTDLDMFVYGFFFNLDDKMRFVPELATEVPTYANGGISKDGLTITYELRRGVKWQDGAPFTAADVVFTTRAILNPKNDVASRTGWDDIASVEAIGDGEVRFKLKKIYAPAVATFFCESGLYPVLPAHLLAKYPDINHVPFDGAPVGTGPFKFVRRTGADSIELAANPLYWRGRPRLDRVEYEHAPDEATIVAQLRSHRIDAWFRAPSDAYRQLEAIPDIRVQTAPSLAYTHLDLDQKDPLFDDVRVRRAIDYAIDKQAIIEGPAMGLGDPAAADVSPLSWAYEPRVERYPYDPARSRALFADAGWKPGPDGVLRKDGKPFAFAITAVSGAPTSVAIEEALIGQLRAVGAAASMKNVTGDRLFAPFEDGGVLYHGDYDAALFAWVAGVDPDDSSEYMCDEIPPAGQNDVYWCDDALDAAERGALSTYDQPTRRRYYAATQEELASQAATIFLYFNRQVFATSPALHGFVPAPAVTSNWNTWEWSI